MVIFVQTNSAQPKKNDFDCRQNRRDTARTHRNMPRTHGNKVRNNLFARNKETRQN